MQNIYLVINAQHAANATNRMAWCIIKPVLTRYKHVSNVMIIVYLSLLCLCHDPVYTLIIMRPLALVGPCLGLFPFVSSFFSSRFLTILLWFLYLLHPRCFHTRGILCGIHTSCIRAPFSIAHAKWSLVFRSFGTNLYWLKAYVIIINPCMSVGWACTERCATTSTLAQLSTSSETSSLRPINTWTPTHR